MTEDDSSLLSKAIVADDAIRKDFRGIYSDFEEDHDMQNQLTLVQRNFLIKTNVWTVAHFCRKMRWKTALRHIMFSEDVDE